MHRLARPKLCESANVNGTMSALPRQFFARHHLTVARDLIGCRLMWHGVGGVIVETEAYAVDGDPACHTAKRPSARKFVAEHRPGTAYVYLNYGVHWLLNVLALDGIVLFRALEPTHGLNLMAERRGTTVLRNLCSGPGKLGQALNLSGTDHGVSLLTPDQHIQQRRDAQGLSISAAPRIGISAAVERPWRFFQSDSPHVSRRSVNHRRRR